jgi:hypothetical protein
MVVPIALPCKTPPVQEEGAAGIRGVFPKIKQEGTFTGRESGSRTARPQAAESF